MSQATVRAPQPDKQKGRPVAGRPLKIFVSNDNIKDTSEALRLQRLRLIGILGQRAVLIAGMVWGEARNG